MIFIVATTRDLNDVIIQEALAASFQGDYYEIGRGQWLVSFAGTAKQLYDKLSPGEEPPPTPQSGDSATPPTPTPRLTSTVVLGVAGYYGRATRDLWEWMAVKLGGKVG